MLSNVPLYVGTTSSYVRHHLSVDEHLGYFHVLATVNNASVNIGVYVSFIIVVFSEYMPSSGIAGSYNRFISSFLK